ncbi:hypothetical protein L9F63_013355, partial [Diploptera punctata]
NNRCEILHSTSDHDRFNIREHAKLFMKEKNYRLLNVFIIKDQIRSRPNKMFKRFQGYEDLHSTR